MSDPNISRIKTFNVEYLKKHKKIIDKEEAPPPAIVEFDLHGTCSRRCAFCPRVDAEKWPNLEEKFELDLYNKIIIELKNRWKYSGRIAWSGYSEPMVHQEIYELIKITKKNLPNCTLDIVSNGDFLTSEVIKKLYSTGLDHLRVSIYTNDKTTQKFKKIREELNIDPKVFFIRERNKGRKNDFGLVLNNRGGAVNLKQIGIKRDTIFPLKRACNYPLFKIFVNYNGDYQICSNDWNKHKIIGNAHSMTIDEVWYSSEFKKIRKNLMNKNRNIDPCKTCDVHGDLNGQEYYDEWAKFI